MGILKPKNRKILFKLVLLLLILIFPLKAESGVGLSVSPQKQELMVFPGDDYRGEFKLHNPNDFYLPVSVSVIPFGAEEGTGDVILGTSESEENPTEWINFERTEMILSPGENARLGFEMNIPADAPPGGYYFFTRFRMRIPDFEEGSSPRAVPEIGVPMMIATTELALDAEDPDYDLMEVTEFSFSAEKRVSFLENLIASENFGIFQTARAETGESPLSLQIIRGEPDSFVLEIRNNDLFHLQPRGDLTVTDSSGRSVLKTEFVGRTILPGKSRRFKLAIDEDDWVREKNPGALAGLYGNLTGGRYGVKLDLRGHSPLRGEISLQQTPEIPFLTVTPFILWGVILLVVGLLLLLRKRIKIALRVLIGLRT